MISFQVTKDGTIKVKPIKSGLRGHICYKFKGMSMQKERAVVVDFDENRITVKRDKDDFLSNFIWSKKHWLLEHNCSSNSLLFGTEFVPLNDEKNI